MRYVMRMAIIAFDTLTFARRMETAGMVSAQAEGFAKALHEVAFDQLVTKHDLYIALKDQDQRRNLRMGAIAAARVTILGALIAFHR